MTLGEFCVSVLAMLEACQLRAYSDTGGVPTIGWGHTGPEVKIGMTITQAQAEAYLQADLKPLLDAVAGKPILEAAGFVSFGFNCGLSAMKRAMAGETNMAEWIHDAKKNVRDNLVRRRQFELALIEVSKSSATGNSA